MGPKIHKIPNKGGEESLTVRWTASTANAEEAELFGFQSVVSACSLAFITALFFAAVLLFQGFWDLG